MTGKSAATLMALGVLAVAAGAVAGQAPGSALLLILLIVGACLVIMKPWASVHMVIVLGLTALPDIFPNIIHFGQFQFYLYQPLLAIAALYAVTSFRNDQKFSDWSQPARAVYVTGWITVAAVAGATIVGVARGYSILDATGEVRTMIDIVLAVTVAVALIATKATTNVLATLRVSLWVSAGFVICAAMGLVSINGRTETAQLWSVGGGTLGAASSATRLLTPATMLATGVICFCLPLLDMRRRAIRPVVWFIVPSGIICFFSYSRNQLLAIAAAAAFAILLASLSGTLARLSRRLLVVAFTVGAVFAGALILETEVSGSTWLSDQAAAYSARVLGGLTSSAQEADTSIRDREQEDAYMLEAVAEEPLTGKGFGYMYKPPLGNTGDFAASPEGRMYGHNFYLWMLMKGGPITLLAFLSTVGFVIVQVFRYRDYRVMRAAGATVVAFAVTSVVAPMPVGSPGGMLFGLAIGGVCGLACDSEADRRNLSRPMAGVR